MKFFFPLCLFTATFISCNAQVETATESTAYTDGQPKLIKTQSAEDFNNVGSAMQDKSGNLWFGTTGEGIYRYDGKTFTNYTMKDGLSSNSVSCILEDDSGAFWVGTDRGVCRLVAGKFVKVLEDTFHEQTVFDMLQDKSGNIWFSTASFGAYRYDPSFESKTGDASITNYLRVETLLCMFEDSRGNIWFGSWSRGGAYRYDGVSFTNYSMFDGLCDDMISSFAEGDDGAIWIATRDSGLCRYNSVLSTGTTKAFTHYGLKDGLCADNVFTLLKDQQGNIWSGHAGKNKSNGAGLCRYDGKTFTNFQIKNGTVNNDIFSMLQDRDGNFWIGKRNIELYRFDGKTRTLRIDNEHA